MAEQPPPQPQETQNWNTTQPQNAPYSDVYWQERVTTSQPTGGDYYDPGYNYNEGSAYYYPTNYQPVDESQNKPLY